MKFNRILAAVIILVLSFSWTSYAESEADYSISKYNCFITINPDGSVFFDEYFTYTLHKDKALIKKPIPTSNTTGIEQLEVYYQDAQIVDPKSEEPSLVQLTKSDVPVDVNNETGNETFYLNDTDSDINYIEIPVNSGRKKNITYVYRYTLKDEIFVYNDTAVLYWKLFMPDNNVEKVKGIEVMVSSPLVDDPFDFMGFITGTIHGMKENLDDGSLRIAADYLSEDEYMAITVLMPVDIVPDGRKLIDNYARESIINDMEVWESLAQKYKKEEQRNKIIGYILAVISVIIVLAAVILFFVIRKNKIIAVNSADVNEKLKTKKSVSLVGIFRAMPGIAKLKNILRSSISAISGNVPILFSKLRSLFVIDKDRSKSRPIDIRAKVMEIESLISGITPAEQGFVINRGKPKVECLLAEILYLVQQRHLIIGYDEDLKGTIYLNNDMEKKKLPPYDEYLIAMLMKETGSGNSITLTELDSLLDMAKTDKMKAKMATWTDLIKKNLDSNKLSDFKRKSKLLYSAFTDITASGRRRLKLIRWEKYIIYAIAFKIANEMFEEIIFNYPETAFDDGNLTILSRNNLPWIRDKLNKNIDNTLFMRSLIGKIKHKA